MEDRGYAWVYCGAWCCDEEMTAMSGDTMAIAVCMGWSLCIPDILGELGRFWLPSGCHLGQCILGAYSWHL